jgi:predicted transposase/invertase (TIGR01784 family)
MTNMINPRVDVAFKKIFGVEENKDLLISLINSIVSQEDQVDHIELLNPYNERNYSKDKLSILDIKARNKITNTYFLIEMQLADETDYHQRSLYSWARVYSNQLSSGYDYEVLKKTIAIHILNFTFIDYKKHKGWKEEHLSKYHHCFTLQDKITKIEIFKDLEIHTIELNKFEGLKDENLDHVLSKVKNMLDTWVALLTRYDLLDVKELPKEIDFPEIKKALKVMQEMKFSDEEREMYNMHLDFLRMEYGALKKKFLDGKLEGKEEGKLEGKLEIAKNLIAKGFDEKTILELTGFTVQEVKKYFPAVPWRL